ncbi:hypothetical protein H6776_02930 [Candidatus Nomurabacteria bacterium]|nr:hypothetical protein [Candidatus Nomurabacteria bacterium]
MKTKKSIYVVLVQPHSRGKNDKRLKGYYRNILEELDNSDMYVFEIDYARIFGSGKNYDPEIAASFIIDEINDFFFNPFALPEIDNLDEDEEGLDDIERLIKESYRINSDTPQDSDSNVEQYPDGNFIHVHIVSDKKLFMHMCEIISEYGFEEEGIEVHAFASSYKLFSEFQMTLMRPLRKKRDDGHTPPHDLLGGNGMALG